MMILTNTVSCGEYDEAIYKNATKNQFANWILENSFNRHVDGCNTVALVFY